MTDQPLSLAELFAKDPRKHTDADLDAIIAELRERRQRYIMNDDKTAGSAKPKSAAAKKKSALQALDLDVKL